jgi:hypothetical protein
VNVGYTWRWEGNGRNTAVLVARQCTLFGRCCWDIGKLGNWDIGKFLARCRNMKRTAKRKRNSERSRRRIIRGKREGTEVRRK